MSDFPFCERCGCGVSVPDDMEHTGYCHECAQSMMVKFKSALELIAHHKHLRGNNGILTSREQVQAMRDIAINALENDER